MLDKIKVTPEVMTAVKNLRTSIKFGMKAIDRRQLETVAMHFRLEELVMLETILEEWENYKEQNK